MSKESDIEPLKNKIDDLNQQAWDVRVSDSSKAFILSQETVELARTIIYPKGLANGLQVLGFCYVRLSKHDEALPILKESLSLFEELNDPKGQSVIFEYLSIIQRTWGDLSGALELLLKALSISEQNNIREIEGTNHYQLGVTYKHLGDFENALEHLYKCQAIWKEIKNDLFVAYTINVIGSIYFETADYKQALDYYLQGLVDREQAGDKWGEAGSLDNIGFTYLKLEDYGQAVDYCKRSLAITRSTGDKKGQANTLLHLAEISKQSNNLEQAVKFCNESLQIRQSSGDKRGEAEVLLFLADLHSLGFEDKDRSQVFEWISNAVKIAEEIKALDLLSKARYYLYEYYKEDGNFKEAVSQLELHINFEKELHKNNINQKILNLEISHKAEETKKETEAVRLRNKELTELNVEIEKQKEQLEKTLQELKATQSQLIQSEKMASLGELTAGIAHEIQNPLNFVNNFSEVNKELIGEMKAEIEKCNVEEVKLIADDIGTNEEKINHHGKRADAIVKGMLQHSRRSTGVKEPTDINALCDEYLRLSYHGLRAKDKSFNATMKTDFDNSIGNINIIPQEIGRVILNLINNAFYAVDEKKKSGAANYEPIVSVSTKRNGDKVEINVGDNGNGIPEKVLDKIFQPFFTTKPTGQGTGLGLSLSYDIVKAHGGELKVETKEGEGSVFIIQFPVNN